MLFYPFKNKYAYFLDAILVSLAIGCLIPFVFLLKSLFAGQEVNFHNFLFGFLFSFSVTFCIYFFNIRIVKKMQKAEKRFRSHFRRISLELLITMSISGIVMLLVFLAFLYISGIEIQNITASLFDNIIIAIIMDVIVVAIIEMVFFFQKWKNSIVESEHLKRKNVEIQYAALASQINPHFLFNSLNTLSSLIQINPEKATVFTREFSKIYRYVLDSRDRLIVTLQEELDFLNSYLYLQRIRYDSGLDASIEIDASCLSLFLPPLSLQLLAENAIKHNEISEENPLHLTIIGKSSRLEVINNYRPIKKSNREGSGLGLKNMTERYSHYTDIVPVFKVENEKYIAIIPLIEDE